MEQDTCPTCRGSTVVLDIVHKWIRYTNGIVAGEKAESVPGYVICPTCYGSGKKVKEENHEQT